MSNEYLDIAMEMIIKQEVNVVLDKIRAEVEEYSLLTRERVIGIIDKYKVGDKE